MARLAMLMTFLVLGLVASMRAVSAHRTTITTVTIDDEENPGRSQGGTAGCHERVHAHQLHHCRQYLSRGREILAMRGGVDEQEPPPQLQQQLQECCQQLRQVEEPCRCKGIRKIAKENKQKEQLQGKELREMIQMAQNLPSACRVPPQRCEINVGEY